MLDGKPTSGFVAWSLQYAETGSRIDLWSWLLSFNRTQSRVVIDLLTGHNTLRRHLYIMLLSNNPICRKCSSGGGNLSPHFVWVWDLGITQTCISVFLLFGPLGYQETKYRGHLELFGPLGYQETKYRGHLEIFGPLGYQETKYRGHLEFLDP